MQPDIDIFFVSKALNPPFDDSGKLLPFLIVNNLQEFRFHVPVNKGKRVDAGNVHSMPIFSSDVAYTAGMRDKAALFMAAMLNRSAGILHFFFSPNRMGNRFGKILSGMRPSLPTVQTIMSLPMQKEGMKGALFADWVVVWSKLGRQWAEEAAMAMPEGKRPKIVHIPPGIVPLNPMHEDVKSRLRTELGYSPSRFLVLFPGDLEFTDTAVTVAHAARQFLREIPATLIMAMRPKTAGARTRLKKITEILAPELADGKVRILGSIDYFQDLLAITDLVLMPAGSTYAKTDIPLAVLQAMSAGVPAIVGRGSAMEELAMADAAISVTPGQPEELAKVVQDLFADHDRLSNLGQRAIDYVQDHHTAGIMAQAFARLYLQILQE